MPAKKQVYEPWEARLGTTSFDPLEAMQLCDAIRKREPTVILGGREFTLTYKGEKVLYGPADGYTPCGYLDIQTVERFDRYG